MKVIFQGDPRIFLSENGSRFVFKGGQPVMDAGFENAVLISLFTRPGWPGNEFFNNKNQKIGSDFEETLSRAITLTTIIDAEKAAQKALQWMIDSQIASKIEISITNPTGQIVETKILIKPPGYDVQELLLTKNGNNWIFQKFNPANERA